METIVRIECLLKKKKIKEKRNKQFSKCVFKINEIHKILVLYNYLEICLTM